jgi:hypothetical protein
MLDGAGFMVQSDVQILHQQPGRSCATKAPNILRD